MNLRPLFLLILPLSGCLGGGYVDSASDGAFAPCTDQAWCHLERLPDGTSAYVLENLVIANATNPSAIQLYPVGTDTVILRNATIRTAGNAVAISAGCARCRIVIENTRLEGLSGAAIGIDATSLNADAPVHLELRNVTIAGFQQAIQGSRAPIGGQARMVNLIVNGLSVDCGTSGLAGNFRAAELRSLYIDGCKASAVALAASDASVIDSMLSASGIGLESEVGGLLRVNNTVFSFNHEYGLLARSGTRIEVTESRFLGNGQNATSPGGGAGALIQVEGFVHASTFQMNRVFGIGSLVVPFDATDNYWGAATGPRVCSGTPADDFLLGDCVLPTTTFIPFRSTP